MPSIAIFTECSVPMWLDVADKLCRRHDWQPRYWTGSRGMEAAVRQRFPDCAYHANIDAIRGIPAPGFESSILPVLDEGLLNDLGDTESIVLRMMDRMDPDGSFSYDQRVRLYHRLVRYGMFVLDLVRPDVVVAPASPHMVYDFILFRLCERAGIRTVMFHETCADGLIYPFERLEDGSPELRRAYASLRSSQAPARLASRSREYLDRVRGDYGTAIPAYVRELLDDVRGRLDATDRDSSTAVAESTPALVQMLRQLQVQAVDRAQSGYRTAKWLARRLLGKNQPKVEPQTLPADDERSRLNSLRDKIRQVVQMPEQAPATKRGIDVLARVRRTDEKSAIQEKLIVSVEALFEELSRRGPVDRAALADAISLTTFLYRQVEREYPFRYHFLAAAPDNYLITADAPAETTSMSSLEYWLYRLVAKRHKQGLAECYAALSRSVDLDRPFVYFPLHYQPEKSTSPEGGAYADQRLAIDFLARTLPPGWTLVVKEHPFQLNVRGSGELSRTEQLYRDVAAHANVRLAPLEQPPFELIDRSRAVASITGTTGWEALVRGKPVFVLGHAWYRDCEGSFYTPTATKLRAALATVEAGWKPSPDAVEHFLQAMDQIGFRGMTIPELESQAGVGEEENVGGFVRALVDRVAFRQAA